MDASATSKEVIRLESRRSQNQHKDNKLQNEKDPDVEQERQVRGVRWILILIALYISCFLYGLDTTISADVQGPIVEAFGHVEQLAWVGAGFPMGSAAVILPVGNMFTSFNMKWLFVASIALFEIGSAVCGAAPSMSALIIGRVLAGAGGSGIYLGCLNIVSALTTAKERGTFITLIGFFWGLGAVLGPVIGGAFSVSGATWRWAFYINLVIGGAMAPAFLFAIPSISPVKGVSLMRRIKKLDFLGYVMSAGIWVSFTIAFIMAGGQWQWNDRRTIAVIVVFGVLSIAFTVQQYFALLTTIETRAFPVHLLTSRSQLLLYIATSANITALWVVVFFIPIYFQFVHNDSAIMAAVRLLPCVIIAITFNLLTGHLLSRVRYYMPIYVISGAITTLGGALLMAYLTPHTPEAHIYGFTILIAIGTGLTLQVGYAIAGFKTRPEWIGDAIALQNFSQVGGEVIALVLAGQIFQSTAVRNLSAVLAGKGFSSADIHSAVAGAQSTLFEDLSGDLRESAIVAITQAIQKSFILVIVAGAVLLVSGAAMKVEPLFGTVAVAH
ncbi:MFS general substrate transporter [Stipitochalara longipes BDJ]|nr:MFS general substrate transporter [Stipitochalara longipes BDJ]